MRHDGQGDRKPPPGSVAWFAVALIRLYQMTLSAITGRNCRFLPTCSSYAAEAIERHGAWRGLWLGLFRLARCHPWGGEGHDPVPETVGRHGLRVWRIARDARQARGRG
jgi:hypothetical protein